MGMHTVVWMAHTILESMHTTVCKGIGMHITTTLVQCTSTSKKPAAVGDPFFLRRPGTDNKQMANGTGAGNSGRNTGIEMGAELDASSERGEGGGPGSASFVASIVGSSGYDHSDCCLPYILGDVRGQSEPDT